MDIFPVVILKIVLWAWFNVLKFKCSIPQFQRLLLEKKGKKRLKSALTLQGRFYRRVQNTIKRIFALQWPFVYQAVAAQPWGQRLMVSTPGFMEFILDRSTGQSKEAKDAKFQLVGSLLSSSSAAEILGSQNYISLKSYRREGPYYVSAVAAVGTEGAE